MDAELLLRERFQVRVGAFAEIVVWRVPAALRGSAHEYKYRLAYVVDRACVLRFDNEVGKGDHVHFGGSEAAYRFTSPKGLLDDFWSAVEQWEQKTVP